MQLQSYSDIALQQQAAEGDPQALTWWLNVSLLPQGFCAQVTAMSATTLNIQVQCRRVPQRDRLVRFICHRLHQLPSHSICRVHLVVGLQSAQPVILWQQSVQFASSTADPGLSDQPRSPSKFRPPHSPRSIPFLAWGPVPAWMSAVGKWLQRPAPFQRPKPVVLIGSGIAAFLLGCMVEAVRYQTVAPSGVSVAQFPPLAQIRPRSPQVVGSIETAAGRVPVLQLSGDPSSSRATLVFSSEVLGSVQPDTGTWQGLPQIINADVAMTSLDVPFAPALPLPWVTRGDRRVASLTLQQLAAGGMDLVQIGSPRQQAVDLRDWEQTRYQVSQAGFQPVAALESSPQAHRPVVVAVGNQTLAYLSYTPSTELEGDRLAPDAPILQTLRSDLAALRDQVDYLIVSYRWGDEIAAYPSDAQMTLAHAAVDAGADLVVGFHPAMLQGAEVYENRAIVYSLGTVPGTEDHETNPAADYDTVMVQVQLQGDDEMQVQFLPVQVRDFQAQLADSADATVLLRYLDQASGLFDQPLRSPLRLSRSAATSSGLAPAPRGLHTDRIPNDEPDAANDATTEPSFIAR